MSKGKKTEADNFVNAVSEAAESTETIKREAEKDAINLQVKKEEAIANVYEVAGKIKAMNFVKKQADFANLVMLKRVKDSKEYRERFGMTWEGFCEHVGINRRWIDEQLSNLRPFKIEYLEGFLQFFEFPMSKIRYLGEAISGKTPEIEISPNGITYNGETIPWDREYSDDFQALLETLEEENKKQLEEKDATIRARERLLRDSEKKQEKLIVEIEKLEGKAQKKGLTATEEGFLQKMETLRLAFDAYYMSNVDPDGMEELWRDNDPTPRMKAAYLTSLDYMRKQILAAYDMATERYGNPVMCPEDAWRPGMGAALSTEDVLKTKQ